MCRHFGALRIHLKAAKRSVPLEPESPSNYGATLLEPDEMHCSVSEGTPESWEAIKMFGRLCLRRGGGGPAQVPTPGRPSA